jgi:hypothetical protein
MAETDAPAKEESRPREPFGPGPLMVFGLVMLLIALWCGKDFFYPSERWLKEESTGKIYLNGAGMIGSALAAVYLFLLAYKRNQKARPPDGPTLF